MDSIEQQGHLTHLNPLLFNTIISHIGSYLTTPELKTYRLISKSWDEELSKYLKKVSQVLLPSDKKLEDFLTDSILNSDFCSSYHLGPNLILNLQEESSHTKHFFSKYGKSIKSLFLETCKCCGNDLKEILYEHCPRLEELSLIESGIEEGLFPSNEDDDEVEEGAVPLPPVENIKCLRVNLTCTRMIRNTKLMADLFKISPNVERISWIRTSLDEIRYDRNFQLDLERAWCAKPHENGTTIRDTICDMAIHYNSIRLGKLNKIESNMRLSNESIQVLQGRRFPLRYLDISLTLDVEQETLASLLQSLSNTLTTLRLEFQPSEAGQSLTKNFFQFVFPRMSKLEHLFVQKFSKNFSFCNNFNHNRLPSLKSLTLCEIDFKAAFESEAEELDRLRMRNDNVRILQVTCNSNKFDLSDVGISNVARFFPNLKEVRIENFERMDRSVWEKSFSKVINFSPPSDKRLGGLPFPKSENECSSCCKHIVKFMYNC